MSRKYIYRFMNFYELYNLLVKNELKFTKLRLMQDQNEGLGEVFRMQSTEAGFMLRNKQEKLEEYHTTVQEQTYISCWTSTPDAMAMWLLYSPDSLAIRVRTNVDKLTEAMPNTMFDLEQVKSAKPGTLLPRLPTVGAVQYADFSELHSSSKRELEAYYARVKDHIHNNGGVEKFPEEPGIESLSAGLLLKDKAYSHESEYRAYFRVSMRNGLSVSEFESVPLTFSRFLGHPLLENTSLGILPPTFSVKVASDFVEEICFDPRMPNYRKSEMLDILGNISLPVGRSDAFGYMIKLKDLTVPE
jgi:hypothetical protein